MEAERSSIGSFYRPESYNSSNRSSRRTSITSIESSKSELWIKYLPLDAATPEFCPTTCTWKRIRKVIFPVEILFLLSIFCYFFFNQIYEQYIFQHLAHIALHVGHNLTQRQFCYNQTYFANETCFQNFQEHVNTVNMAIAILYLSLTGIASLVLGPLSDVIGRKRALFWSILGIVLCSFFQLFVIHFELNPYTYSIGAFMFGSFGGHAALIGLAFAAVADVTSSKRCLTLRMGLLEACITVGQATGSAALNNWIQQDNCNFSPPVWLMFLIAVTAIVYVCLMTEPTTGRREEYGHDRNNMKQILNGFKCFLVPGYIGIRKWWRLWVATGIIILECLTIIGGNEIITYYLHNKPLEWSYGKIGVYEPVVNLAKGLSLIILLPLLLALKFSNGLLCLTAALFAVATNIIMATIQTDWAMYLAGILQGVTFISLPAIRTILSQLVPPQYLGTIFSITASLQMIAAIGSTVLFNEVYHPQAVINGYTVNSGIVFYITAGIWALAIPLVLLLMCCKMRPNSIEPIGLIDDEDYLIISHSTITTEQREYGTVTIQ